MTFFSFLKELKDYIILEYDNKVVSYLIQNTSPTRDNIEVLWQKKQTAVCFSLDDMPGFSCGYTC